jgi:hypothetical protein
MENIYLKGRGMGLPSSHAVSELTIPFAKLLKMGSAIKPR